MNKLNPQYQEDWRRISAVEAWHEAQEVPKTHPRRTKCYCAAAIAAALAAGLCLLWYVWI